MGKAFAKGTDFSKNLKGFGQSPQSLKFSNPLHFVK
jgi:hypothetical protein